MALVRGASDDLQHNLQDEDFDRRIGALEKAVAALVSAQSQQGGQTTVQQVIQQLRLYVGEVGGILLPTDTLLFDGTDGFAVSQDGDALRVDREATVIAPEDVSDTAGAGTETKSANADHTHALGIGTTQGDLIVWDDTPLPVRLPVGADGDVLTANSALPEGMEWVAPAGGPGSLIAYQDNNNTTINAAATSGVDIDIIRCTNASAVTVNLPTANGIKGHVFVIKRAAAVNAVTVEGDGSESLDSAANKSLNSQYAVIAIVSDDTNWQVLWTLGTVA